MKLPSWLVWIITHLLGSHALDHLADKIKTAIGTQLAANPSLSRDAAIAFADAQAEALVNSLLRYPLFSLTAPILEPLLLAQVSTLAGTVYDQIVAALNKAVDRLTPGSALAGGTPQ